MPLLTPEQILKLQQIIRDGSLAVAIATMGYEVPPEELQRLVDEGFIDPGKIENIVLDSFSFGQLMDKVEGIRQMGLPEFEKYLENNPVSLSKEERHAYDIAKHRAGTFCVGLGNRYADEAGQRVITQDHELAEKVRGIIRDETAVKVVQRKTMKQLKSALSNATKDWGRDWDRIAQTESHLAHQEGFLKATVEQHGDEELLAKIPEPTACPDCNRLYLENGKPKVRPASWWEGQGVANVGRKRKDWRPVLGAMHPFCRCMLVRVPQGWGFNEDWDLVPDELIEKSEANKCMNDSFIPTNKCKDDSIESLSGLNDLNKSFSGANGSLSGAYLGAIRANRANKMSRKGNRDKKDQSLLEKAEQMDLLSWQQPAKKEPVTQTTGPYIGPRGGKWKDAKHTIPWDEPKKPRGKQISVPSRGQITKEYMKALSNSFKKVAKQAEKAKTGTELAKQIKNIENYLELMKKDLLFARDLWKKVKPSSEIKKPKKGAPSFIVREYKKEKASAELQEGLEWFKLNLADQRSRSKHVADVIAAGREDRFKEVFGDIHSIEEKRRFEAQLKHRDGDIDRLERDRISYAKEDLKDVVKEGMKKINKAVKEIIEYRSKEPRGKRVQRKGTLRQLKIGNMSIGFEDNPKLRDPKRTEKNIVESLTQARRILEQKGLGHLWHGELLVRSPGERVLATGSEAAADYDFDKDRMRVFYTSDLTKTILYELGHRYYFKNLSQEQRARFEDQFGKIEAVSEYGGTNPWEDFAEVFSYYMLGEELTRDQLERFKTYLGKSEDEDQDELEKARKLDGRLDFQGFQISIENKAGSYRNWYDPHTKTEGKTKMIYPYGYIRMTEAPDGDHVDVFIGPNKDAKRVYVIHQMKAPSFKEFDEDKCMMGFDSAMEAKQAYLKHFDNPKFFGSMTAMPLETFRKKVYSMKRQMIKSRKAKSSDSQMSLPFTDPISELERWEKAVSSVGIPLDQFYLVVKYAQKGHGEARKALDAVYVELKKGFGSDTFGSSAYGSDPAAAEAARSHPIRHGKWSPVGTMGHHSKPARTAGENVRSHKVAEPREDWPPQKQDFKKKNRCQKRDLPRAVEKLDLVGESRGKGGWAHEEYDPKLVVGMDYVERKRAAEKSRENLEVQQAGRMALREGQKLADLDVHQ